jgi:hypothetical protein
VPMSWNGPRLEDLLMTGQVWGILAGVSFLALVGIAFLRWQMPVFRWYCRRCKKIVSSGRFHPGKCTCGTNALVAYVCRACTSWNTSPTVSWHCSDCSSKDVTLRVEYHLVKAQWKWRNQAA